MSEPWKQCVNRYKPATVPNVQVRTAGCFGGIYALLHYSHDPFASSPPPLSGQCYHLVRRNTAYKNDTLGPGKGARQIQRRKWIWKTEPIVPQTRSGDPLLAGKNIAPLVHDRVVALTTLGARMPDLSPPSPSPGQANGRSLKELDPLINEWKECTGAPLFECLPAIT